MQSHKDRIMFGPFIRWAVLPGLGALVLGGCCACMTPPAKPPAAVSAAAQDPSRPKTVGEFMKQPPARLPFNEKE